MSLVFTHILRQDRQLATSILFVKAKILQNPLNSSPIGQALGCSFLRCTHLAIIITML